eukprot:1193269-Alexandrium_andersonii.AAC.1
MARMSLWPFKILPMPKRNEEASPSSSACPRERATLRGLAGQARRALPAAAFTTTTPVES